MALSIETVTWALLIFFSVTMLFAWNCVKMMRQTAKDAVSETRKAARDAMAYLKAQNLAEKVNADSTERQLETVEAALKEKLENPPPAPPEKVELGSSEFLSRAARDGVVKDEDGNVWRA